MLCTTKQSLQQCVGDGRTIIESVDSISRDDPDTPIYIIHYKKRNNSEQENFKRF